MGPPFRVGRVIGRSFLLWLRSLPLLFALVLVVNVPYIAYRTYDVMHAEPKPDYVPLPDEPSLVELLAYLRPHFVDYLGFMLGRSLFTRLSQAVVIFAAYRRLRGERPSFRASLRGAFRRFWTVVLIALALLAIEFTLVVVLTVAYWFALLRVPDWTYASDYWLYSGYALHALLLLLMTPFWVAVPAVIAERRRAYILRSWDLTRGQRLRVFGILVFAAALDYGADYLLAPVARGLPFAATQTIWWAKDLLLISVNAVLAVVGYRALRLSKEGLDVTRLEEIFG